MPSQWDGVALWAHEHPGGVLVGQSGAIALENAAGWGGMGHTRLSVYQKSSVQAHSGMGWHAGGDGEPLTAPQ